MRKRALLFSFLLISFSVWGQASKKAVVHTMPGAQADNEASTARYLESVRNQPSLLLTFLQRMPKGGDLHLHLSGSIYTENYIRWAADDDLCLNRQSFSFVPPPCDTEKGTVPASQVLKDSGLYQQVINAQSMRFFNGPESAHDHFFNAFGKFGAVSRAHQGEMLAEVASRAAAQNLSYLELLLAPDKGEAGRFPSANGIAFTDDFASLRQTMLEKGIGKVAAKGSGNLDQFESKMREVMKCGTPQANPGCGVTVRYQFEIHRGLPPDVVFAEMLVGFEMASADPRVVDVNPVMPEDAYIPMHDFDLHMRMLEYLHGVYPKVKLSLHAGELWTGIVPPDGLRDHIRKSIAQGHASRIGHGVDVMFEDNAPALLKEMAAKKIAVEINLSSNDMILGVRGNEHPLPIYLNAGVPITISTDDEGVSRSDMTQEYWRAVRTYPLTYQQLKQIVRNSLEYSFATGDSLWSDFASAKRNAACVKDLPALQFQSLGSSCREFLRLNDKADMQWHLEEQFAKFEAGECCAMHH